MSLLHMESIVMVSRPGDFFRPIERCVRGDADCKLAAGEAGEAFHGAHERFKRACCGIEISDWCENWPERTKTRSNTR